MPASIYCNRLRRVGYVSLEFGWRLCLAREKRIRAFGRERELCKRLHINRLGLSGELLELGKIARETMVRSIECEYHRFNVPKRTLCARLRGYARRKDGTGSDRR